jgi:hypothetical protein
LAFGDEATVVHPCWMSTLLSDGMTNSKALLNGKLAVPSLKSEICHAILAAREKFCTI